MSKTSKNDNNKSKLDLDAVLDIDLSGTKREPHPVGRHRAICVGCDVIYIKKEGPNKGIPMFKTTWQTEFGKESCALAVKPMYNKDGEPIPPKRFAAMLKAVLGINSDDAEEMKGFKPSQIYNQEAYITVEESSQSDDDGIPYTEITKFESA